MMRKHCPAKSEYSCDIFRKIDCFQQMLIDDKLISVSNGTTRFDIDEAMFSILRRYSTSKGERDGATVDVLRTTVEDLRGDA